MEPQRRVFLAIAIPLSALAGAAIIIWSVSRVFLAVDPNIAPVVGILVSVNILVAAGLAASLPRRGAIIGLILAVAIPAVASGVVSAIAGERPVHNLVEGEHEGGGGEEGGGEEGDGEGEGGTADRVEISADALVFDTDAMTLPAETEVTVVFDNQDDGVPHNWSMYAEAGGEPIFQGELITGPDSIEYTFTTPGPGTYYFQCDVHPDMNGTVEVVAGGGEGEGDGGGEDGGGEDGGGEDGGGEEGGEGAVTIVAAQLAFDQTELTVPAGAEVTVTLDNQDSGVPHNWSAYLEQGGEPIAQGEIVTGPATVDTSFLSPGPGSYYFQCDVHPDMNGTLTVA